MDPGSSARTRVEWASHSPGSLGQRRSPASVLRTHVAFHDPEQVVFRSELFLLQGPQAFELCKCFPDGESGRRARQGAHCGVSAFK